MSTTLLHFHVIGFADCGIIAHCANAFYIYIYIYIYICSDFFVEMYIYAFCIHVLFLQTGIYSVYIFLFLQIVYILDQVRALEKEMCTRIDQQGLEIKPQILVVTRLIPDAKGTTCNQRLEKINGTTNAQILRVPFKQKNGEVLQQWVSRWTSKPVCTSMLGATW